MSRISLEIDRVETLKILEDKLALWSKEEAEWKAHCDYRETKKNEYDEADKEWNKKAIEFMRKNAKSDSNDVGRAYHGDYKITLAVSVATLEEAIGKKPEWNFKEKQIPGCLNYDCKDRRTNIDRLRNTVQMLKLSIQPTISGTLAKNAFDLL